MNTATRELSPPTEPVKFSPSDTARFWAKVDKNGPLPDQSNPHYIGLDQCWNWTAAIGGRLYKSERGYGQIKFKDTLFMSHRISWEMHFGTIPAGKCVLHRCDNSKCCNPGHLFLGTKGENNGDRETKRRGKQPTGNRHGTQTKPERVLKGEQKPNVKLSEIKVREIRNRSAAGVPLLEMAEEFFVSTTLIRNVITRKVWKHVI